MCSNFRIARKRFFDSKLANLSDVDSKNMLQGCISIFLHQYANLSGTNYDRGLFYINNKDSHYKFISDIAQESLLDFLRERYTVTQLTEKVRTF